MTTFTLQASDSAIERKITTGFIVSAEFIKGIIPDYNPRLMTAPFAVTVIGWALDYFNRFGKEPPLSHISDIFHLQRASLGDSEADLIVQFINSISNEFVEGEGDFNIPYMLDSTRKYFKKRALTILKEDLGHHLEGGNIDMATQAVEKFKVITAVQQALGPGYTGKELLQARFAEPRWIVRDLLPEGFSPLCGPPKVGKSFLALNLALSIATGWKFLDRYDVEKGEAIYLDFELAENKLQGRLSKCLGGRHDLPGLENLHLRPKGSWPRIHQGGLEMLEDFAKERPGLKLVVIDVWRKFSRPRKPQEENSYNLTYEDVGPVKDFADSHGICVLVLHHLAKGWRQYDSPFEAFLGSTALAGASDNLFALVRGSEEADGVLWATGRDIEESKTALEFVKDDCTWRFLGDAQHFELTQDQNAIAQAISEMGEASPKDIAAAVGKSGNSVREMLFRMTKMGRVEKVGYGKYRIPTNTPNSPNTINTPNSPNTPPPNGTEGIRGNRGISTLGEGETIRRPTPKTSPTPKTEQQYDYTPYLTRECGDYSFRMCMAIQDEIRKG
ncbi:MAG: AAA family ATPase [Thermodesulfobacteriota bacterium]